MFPPPSQVSYYEKPVPYETVILELLGPERETVNPVTGICTWKAIAIDKQIDKVPLLYEGKHQAEAYHAGDTTQYLDINWRGYLAEKYPLMEEYKPWKMGKRLGLFQEIFGSRKGEEWLMINRCLLGTSF